MYHTLTCSSTDWGWMLKCWRVLSTPARAVVGPQTRTTRCPVCCQLSRPVTTTRSVFCMHKLFSTTSIPYFSRKSLKFSTAYGLQSYNTCCFRTLWLQGGFMSRLLLKDLGLAESAAEQSNAPIQFGRQALSVYKDICKAGKADQDFSVVYEYLQQLQYNK